MLFSDLAIYVLDMIGVIACAVAGTTLALYKRFDIFGCILVSMVGAIGGGTLRDVMLDRHPLFWMTDLNYVFIITITSLICQIFFQFYKKVGWTLKFFDAIGLSAFSLIGLKVALSYGTHPLIAVQMAVLTSIAGGIMRDMICNEIPLVLQKEIYISASIAGSCLYLALNKLEFSEHLTETLTLITTFGVRMLAVRFDWHLPSLQIKPKH
ncbi:MAG: trimeric intracellular cation channel family protein [Moraxella sp.]|uniref:trimeric intracellular cation channel family protein n=1 Tax=Moraxella sp. TaxID=479 RepID=UPI0026DAE188|nr:trimeric intracellular cation channel family protein [Moraxella sp.]MDO4451117.1 trimeric intracellular cation channel family protein [Moraxella sp.]